MCPHPHPNQAHFLSSNRFMRHGSEGDCSLSASQKRASGVLPTSPGQGDTLRHRGGRGMTASGHPVSGITGQCQPS
jgi:hypothetical protein